MLCLVGYLVISVLGLDSLDSLFKQHNYIKRCTPMENKQNKMRSHVSGISVIVVLCIQFHAGTLTTYKSNNWTDASKML